MEEHSNKKLNKFHELNYMIDSKYYHGNDKEILVISDSHYHKNAPKETFEILVDYCRTLKPDYVVMPGDLIETVDVINTNNDRKFIEGIIRSISEVCPTIITLGNHDMGDFNAKTFIKRSFVSNDSAIYFFDSLNKYPNVYFLNNEQVMIDGIMFFGFNPSLKTYLKKNDKITSELLIKDYINSNFVMDNNNYNVLVTHSSLNITNSYVMSSISDFNDKVDLAITGHFHGGRLPKILKNHVKSKNIGLFFVPFTLPIPGIICRGVHDFGRGYLFISEGFRKWTADLQLFNLLESITANDVEKLTIHNSDNKIKVKK